MMRCGATGVAHYPGWKVIPSPRWQKSLRRAC
ncbi:E11 [Escherichia phage Mu]|nr:E11 [Escherichia phage Mu]